MKLSRRSLLAGLAIASATGGRAQGRPAYDTIVIGAGLSGLRTAMLLASEGQRVLVLEASSRVGGRIYTLDALPGHPEAGANTMLSGYGRALALSAALGLPLIDISPRVKLARTDLVIGGERIAVADWKNAPGNPLPEAFRALPPAAVPLTVARSFATLGGEAWCDPANARFDIGMDAALRQAGLSDAAIDLAYNTNPGYGRDASEVSLLNLLFVSSFFATQAASGSRDHVVSGGNQRLPEAIARTMKAELRLQTPVVAVTQDSSGSMVRTAAGETLRAAHVVCAVPLGPLGRIAFDPPLPPLHREAADSVPYMAIRQAHIVADAPFWAAEPPPALLWTDQPLGTLIANRGNAADAEITSFTAWSRGALAEKLDAAPTGDASGQIIDAIARAWPASRGRLRVAATHSWKSSPWQDGAWAVWKPGQASRLPRATGLAHGRLHFCGEHSALSARGMEGALESAERAAVEVLLA